MSAAAGEVRLAELLISLSLAIDIGLGLPMETMLRAALVSSRLAAAAGCSQEDAAAAYYLALIRYVGCTTTARDDSVTFGGDELAVADLIAVDDDEFMPVVERTVGANKTAPERAEAIGRFFSAITSGFLAAGHRMHCEAAAIIARRLDLGNAVIDGLADIYERWDGRGTVRQASGEELSLPMRIAQVALLASYKSRIQQPAAVGATVAARGGWQLDPSLTSHFAADPVAMLAESAEVPLVDLVLAAEPGVPRVIAGEGIDRGLAALADFGDFKSPHMLGHSRRVATVAAAAARAASMPASDVALTRRAALVHDVGRVGVQAQLLSKTGPLTPAEHERIRLHTYLTERIFAASPVLRPIGGIGGLHHERLDSSGYHRGLAAPMLPAPARLLAAANAWCAFTEPRPHRPRMTEDEAAVAMRAEAKSGRLDERAVDAVLTAAGQKSAQSRRAASIALSEREIEVVRLVARQQSNKEIARSLGISPKTVERHVTHVYDKLGVTTRAGAALYATENGLL